jgi:dolichol kinase
VVKNPEDTEVQALSRSSSPSELLFGPVQGAAVLVWVSWKMFRREEAAVLAASLAVSDGLAPLAAKLYTRQVYRHPVKQTEGTIAAFFLGTVLYCYLYQWWLGFPLLPLRIVLAYGFVAAVVGTVLKGVDNVAVPVALHLLIPRIQEWLPA